VSKIKPIYLLSDSQSLFWKDDNDEFLLGGLSRLYGEHARVAYIGVSNGNRLEFYDIFLSAMDNVGLQVCQMVAADSEEDIRFLKNADVIVLGGGDTQAGWHQIQALGFDRIIIERYLQGATLIGVSAGAVQLGSAGWVVDENGQFDVFPTFQLIPYIVGVHEEPDWERLNQVLASCAEKYTAFGIPSGGGAIVHPDLFVEPVRYPLMEIDEYLNAALLYPPDEPKVIVERGEDQIRIPEDDWSKMVH
jgi:peptidase E